MLDTPGTGMPAEIPLPDRTYDVILADPEWRFEVRSRATGLGRSADRHYRTSPTEVIAARPVASIAKRDAVLLLWATVPMLPHALRVMAAWGFDYKSHCVWVKPGIGTGYWFRNRHELLLLGTRGRVPAPAPETLWPSTIEAPRRRHSEKPEFQYALVDAYFPGTERIELNARQRRLGWDFWGLEA
jgi:N6-adenosine-specific RNA methylase IME4